MGEDVPNAVMGERIQMINTAVRGLIAQADTALPKEPDTVSPLMEWFNQLPVVIWGLLITFALFALAGAALAKLTGNLDKSFRFGTQYFETEGSKLSDNRIFISYRRSDSIRETGRIYDYLENQFGHHAIFKDVDTIDAGDDFRDRVKEAVGQCQILLAVIGPTWLESKDEAGRQRLENPADWVRLEIETALKRNIRVIPILLDGVPMPRPGDLPIALQDLTYRNAAPVRHDPDFRRDMERLRKVIERHFKDSHRR